jgi:hypothetical protein
VRPLQDLKFALKCKEEGIVEVAAVVLVVIVAVVVVIVGSESPGGRADEPAGHALQRIRPGRRKG